MAAEPVSTLFAEVFENAITYCEQHPTVSKELIRAKEEFFARTGKLKEDSREFENRINAYLLWFLFDRRFRDSFRSPLFYYKNHLEKREKRREIELLNEMVYHIHSLFEFIHIKNGQSLIKDVVTRKKYAITDENSLFGFARGLCFETRLFSFRGDLCLANYSIRHPMAVKTEIGKQLKTIKGDRKALKDFLLELHSFHTKWISYRNIDIKNIYRIRRTT